MKQKNERNLNDLSWQAECLCYAKYGYSLNKISKKLIMHPYFNGHNPYFIVRRYLLENFKDYESILVRKPKKKKAEHKDEPVKKVIFENLEPNETTHNWDGGEKIRFALIGDTQFGSKYAQITHLHAFYDILEKEGINTVYHTGDITDGIKMRPGHEYELYVNGADEMKDDVVKNYPKRNGINTYFITGNHDASLFKHVGYDIGKNIASERKDLIYLGRDCATVNITPNCTLEMRHPWNGSAYSISYRIQKMVESMDADSKPKILAVGHYHKAEYIFYRNVHCLQTACFQSQTPFTRGKGISVHMGGWIIELNVDKDGTIKQFKQTYIPFYSGIQEDYKKYI